MQQAASIHVPNGARRRAIVFLALAAGILWVPVVSALFGTPPPFLRNLGFLSGPGGTPLAWIVGLLVALAYSGFAVINIPLVRENCCALSPAKLLAIAAAFAAAIVEEAFFRRLLMDGLLAAGASAVARSSLPDWRSASPTASGESPPGA